ncbi:uncharacterized protein LOC119189435 [Manduca sexta]|uniref:uncharacterized protein LOC119189435 n=1 Tax=Manduca sexta TaxID=7130 RepID=UPI00188E6DE0|nr:uncharacterized protein LOC119189435 [Manduca sexta]
MATFGILSCFDHSIQEWKAYKSRLSQWFIANDIDEKSDATGKRRAILLSALKEATYKLASDLALPKDLQDVPYEDIIKILDDHFTPKKCGFSERQKFYSSVQQQGETHQQWAARLRGLTADCGFTNVEEILRDRFVLGMLAGPEKEKLFSHDMKSLTLAKAVQVAGSIRSAQAGAAATAVPERTTPQVFQIKRREGDGNGTSLTGKEKCSVCGRSNHNSTQCRFINYKCKKCFKKGHLRNVCKEIKYMGVGDVNEDDDDDGKLLNIRSLRGEPMTEVVIIGGIKLRFEIDTGSAVTVINEKTSEKKHIVNISVTYHCQIP